MRTAQTSRDARTAQTPRDARTEHSPETPANRQEIGSDDYNMVAAMIETEEDEESMFLSMYPDREYNDEVTDEDHEEEGLECMPVTDKTDVKMLNDHIRSGHIQALPPGVSCESCIKGTMRDKPAYNVSKTSSQEDKLETMNADILDMLTNDCNGDRYNVTTVIQKSGLGMSFGQARKDAITTGKTLAKAIDYIQAKTDPGDKTGYKIQQIAHDPGMEFKGACQDEMARRKIVRREGEVDRHADNALVENRNQRLQNTATAMAITAMGDNVAVYSEEAGCQAIRWANHCINHAPITKEQRASGKTAYQEQYNCEDTIDNAYGIKVHTWGELTYMYIIKSHRKCKLGGKAVRCIWNGANLDNVNSHSAIPIVRQGDKWKLKKPIHSAKVVTISGVFPLAMEISAELPTPPGMETGDNTDSDNSDNDSSSDNDSDDDDEDDEESYEIEKVVQHHETSAGFEYKLRFKGYSAEHDQWTHASNCTNCQDAIARYWQNQCMAISAATQDKASTDQEDKGVKEIKKVRWADQDDKGVKEFKKISSLSNNCMLAGEVQVKSEHSVNQHSKMWLESSTGSRGDTGTDKPTNLETALPTAPPEFQAMMVTEAECGPGMDYHKNIVMHCGEEMAMEVGGVELKLDEVLAPENREAFQKAHDKEITQMTSRRFVRPGDEATKHKMYKPVEQLTDEEKKRALKCRLSYTRKRPELDQGKGQLGAAKARLVAKDLKILHKLDARETYAATPPVDGFRLMVASCQTEQGDELSSTDFETAFLQSTKWEDKLVLIVYKDPFTGQLIYEWLSGVIYGMQTGAYDWKDTLSHYLTTEMGFVEASNMQSMYHHQEKQITISCHVDDPLALTRIKQHKEWFYDKLEKDFDIKGNQTLTEANPLDYLSIRISLDSKGNIRLDNQAKIQIYLEEKGLTECNPTNVPIQKTLLQQIFANKKEGIKQDDDDQKLTEKYLGEAQWLAQTTHPTIATALSMISSVKNTEGALSALTQVFRYLKGRQDYALVKEAGNNEGFRSYSDADWAGLYDLSGGIELRSRTGAIIYYNGMAVTWGSYFQQCRGTDHKTGVEYTEDLIALSSAESEIHAAADAAKESLHLKYIAEELGIPVPAEMPLGVDAGAALGFIRNTTSVGRQKHINLKMGWVKKLRQPYTIDFYKVMGTDNPADLFTKIQTSIAFKQCEETLIKKMQK
jgi:hypothetical protein